jgi:Tlde1 domain
MTSVAATLSRVTTYDRRRAPADADYRRALRRTVGIGVGTLTAVSGTAGAVTLTAAWMIAAAISSAPHAPGLPSAQDRIALSPPSGGLAGRMIADFDAVAGAASGLSRASPSPEAERAKDSRLAAPVRRRPFPLARFFAVRADEGAREAAMLESLASAGEINASPQVQATPPSGYVAAAFDLFDPQPTLAGAYPVGPQNASSQPAAHIAERTGATPSSVRRPGSAAPAAAPLQLADAEATPVLPPAADAEPAPHSSLTGFLRKLFGRQQADSATDGLPAIDDHTAIYDIEARTVYLPNGERLEAHSGLGSMMDDPHYVSRKDRGPTPPNVYDLVLREGSFHGVQAIRLKPVNDDKMFGRAGILAHPYMLGPSGQSFGCVSFKDYRQFLKAFESGKIDRLVVLPYRGDYQRYAAND